MYSSTPFRSVLAYAPPGVSTFALGAVSHVFADRSGLGLPRLDFATCSARPGTVLTDLGMSLRVERGPEAMADADLIIVLPTGERPLTLPAPVKKALIQAHRRRTIIAAYCTGSFLLAETGLLEGLRATTDWQLATQLAERYPAVTVEPDLLYVDQGRLITSACTAAGIDMCLHLLRREHGATASDAIARAAMVVPRYHSGQIHQSTASPLPDVLEHEDGDAARIADLLVWARTQLHQPISSKDMAEQALMSYRTFIRRFQAVTGTTPYAWLTTQRVDHARHLLRTTGLSVQQIAVQVGLNSANVLRAQFAKRHGLPPSAYRSAVRELSPAHLTST